MTTEQKNFLENIEVKGNECIKKGVVNFWIKVPKSVGSLYEACFLVDKSFNGLFYTGAKCTDHKIGSIKISIDKHIK